MKLRPIAIVLALLACSFALTACEDASDKAAEKIAEQTEGIDDVEIDSETGEVTVKSDTGEEFSTSQEVPEGWPSELALPDGAKVMGSSSTGKGGANQVVTGTTKQGAKAFAAKLKEQLEGAGWKTRDKVDTAGVANVVLSQFTKGKQSASIQASEAGNETSFTIVLAETP